MNWTVKVLVGEDYEVMSEKSFETIDEAFDYGWSIQDGLEGKIWGIYNAEGFCVHSTDVTLINFTRPVIGE